MWAGMTLYPETKCTPARAIDILETYGSERIWMNSACDWGVSDPLAVPKTALEMKKRGHLAAAIEKVIFSNPKKFLQPVRQVQNRLNDFLIRPDGSRRADGHELAVADVLQFDRRTLAADNAVGAD